MAKVTIKGKEYRLGEISGSVENFEIVGQLMSMGKGTNFETLLPGARRILEESIAASEGKKVAAKAMGDLTISLSKESDMMKACEALVASLME